MRSVLYGTIFGGLLLGMAACDRPVTREEGRAREQKTDEAAHKVGEQAYKVTEKTKEVTKEAVKRLEKAGREVRDGWEDAKHSDPDPDPPRSRR